MSNYFTANLLPLKAIDSKHLHKADYFSRISISVFTKAIFLFCFVFGTHSVYGQMCTGNASTFLPNSSGVVNPGNAVGSPNTSFAQVHGAGDTLYLDLGDILDAGEIYTIHWRRRSTYVNIATANMIIEEATSFGGPYTVSDNIATSNNTTFITSNVVTDVATKYLKVYPATGTDDDFDFDAVSYSNVDCSNPWPNQTCNGESSLLHSGVMPITCGVVTGQPSGERYTLAYITSNIPIPAGTRTEVTDPDSVYHNPNWDISDIGNVFGLEINEFTSEVFVTASSNYGSSYFGQTAVLQYGSIGGGANNLNAAGTVYVIDPTTGQPSVFAQLPQQLTTISHRDCEFDNTSTTRNTGVGLGNITYDVAHNQYFVSNVEDGRIYRISSCGVVLDSYDPLTYDDGVAGISLLEEVPYGLAVEPGGSRLFFGTSDAVAGNNFAGVGNPGVYSIDLNADGTFAGTLDNTYLPPGITSNYVGTETLHRTIPTGSGSSFTDETTYFISDLEFTPNGDLLVGIRTGCYLTWFSSYNHYGETDLLRANGSLYSTLVVEFDISSLSGAADEDSYGGVTAYTNSSGTVIYAASSSDIIDEDGPHGIAYFEATSATGQPLAAFSYGITDNLGNGDPKGVGGDVEAFSSCQTLVCSASNDNSVACEGEDVNLSVTATFAVNYSWTGPNGFSSSLQNPTITNLQTSDSGTYTVVITDANGCQVSTCSTSITVNPLPTVTLSQAGDGVECEDGTDINFTATPVNGMYSSNIPSGFTFNNSTGLATLDVSAAGPGVYQVTYTYVDGNGCENSDVSNVEIFPAVNVTLNDPADMCLDGVDMLFTATPAGGTFTTTAASGFIPNNGAGTAVLDLDVAGPGVYDVTYSFTSSDGCMDSETVSVEVFDLPTVTLSDPSDACVNDSDMFFTASPTGGTWSSTASGFSGNSGAGTASIDVSVAGPGVYTVTYDYTDANGCDNSQTVNVEIFDVPTVTINDPADVCIDGSDMLFNGTPIPMGGTTGVFTTSATGLTDNGDGTANLDVSIAGAGTFTVTYTYTDANGCEDSQTTSVEVFPEPTVTLSDPADQCEEGSDMNFTASPVPGGGTTGVFSTTAGAGFTDNGDGTAALDVSVAGAGTYDVTYTFTDANGCDQSQTVSVEIFPEPTVTLSDPVDQCANGSDMLFAGTPVPGAGTTGVFSTTAAAGFTDNGDGTAALDVSLAGAGTYDVTYTFTDANGCDQSQTVSVEIFSVPALTLNDPADQCVDGTDMNFMATPIPGGGTTGVFSSPSSGLTDNSDGTAVLDISSAGVGVHDITYTFTDGNGCINTETVSVEVFALPNVTLTDPADECVNGTDMTFVASPAGGTFSTTATGGFAPNNAAGIATLDVSTAGVGTYDVTYVYVDGNGCTNSETVSVTVFDIPSITLNDPNDACVNGGDLNFTATPVNGTFSTTAPAGFSQDGAAGTALLDVDVAGPGTYDVTYTFTDLNGCTNSATVSVTVNDIPTIVLNDPADVCINGADLNFTATPVGGVFNITAPGGFSQDGAAGTATLDVDVAGAGTYNVFYTFTDANGCRNTEIVSVTIFPLTTITLNDPADVCIDGSDLNFVATPPNGVFTTTAPGGFSQDGAAGTAILDVDVAGAGTYDVTYTFTDGNGCINSETVSVTVNPLPTVTLSDPADVCISGSDMLFLASPEGGVFTTTAPAGFIPNNAAGTAQLDVSVAGAGTYDVTYTFTDLNGCVNSEITSVTVFPLPVITLSDPDDMCIDGVDMVFMATPITGTYSTTAGAGFTDNGNGTAVLDISVAGVGVYDVSYEVTDINGCVNTETVSVEVFAEPVVTLNDPANQCEEGTDMVFTGSPIPMIGTSGVFTTTAVGGFTDNADGTADLDVSVAGAGVYDVTYTYTDANGCDQSQTVSVEVFAEPVVTLNDPTDQCEEGTDMAFTGSPIPMIGTSGVFTTTAVGGFTDNGDGTADLDVSVAGAGVYDVTYTYTDANGCDQSQTVSVEVFAEPVVTLNDPTDQCEEGSDMAFTGSPIPMVGTSGVFTTTAVGGFTDNGDGTADLDVSVAGAGVYDVTYIYTDANGCDQSQTVSVEVFAEPVVTLNDPTDQCEEGTDMAFTGSPIPMIGTSGVFTTTAVGGFTDNGDGTADLDVSAAGAGVYDVTYTYTDANGCDQSQTVSVEVFAEPVVTLNDPTDQCEEGSDMAFTGSPIPMVGTSGVFTTTAVGGFTDNGDGTADLDVSAAGAGVYDVTYTYTDANGCDQSQTVSVEVFAEPVVTLNDPTDQCEEGTDMAFTGSPIPMVGTSGVFTTTAVGGFTDNGDGTADLDVSAAGAGVYDVTYTYTDANGCDQSQTVSVEVFAEPVVTLNDPTDQCEEGTDMAFTGSPIPMVGTSGVFTTTAVGGFTDNGDGTADLDVSAAGAGVYDVTYTYTDANGCDQSQTVSVEVFAEPIVTLNDPVDQCTDGIDMDFFGTPIPAGGAMGVFTSSSMGASLNDNGNGTAFIDVSTTTPGIYDITYTYTDANGCDQSQTVSVEIFAEPVVTLNDPIDQCTDGTDMNFSGSPVPGGGALGIFTVTPAGASLTDNSDGTANIDVSNSTPGIYDVTYTYTDVNGCDNSETVSVEIFALPTVVLNDPSDQCIDGSIFNFMATPVNGVFTTNAPAGFAADNVNGTATLDPAIVGVGVYDVTYTFTSPDGCVDSETVSVEVFPLPVVSLTSDLSEVCVDGMDISFTATPVNGTFSSTAASGFAFDNTTGLATLDVSQAGAGTYDITYSFTDLNGCESSETISVIVNPLPVITLTDPSDECIDGSDLDFTATPVGGTFTTTALGTALSQNSGAGTATLDVSEAGAGTYDVIYTYTDSEGCTNSETVSVTVNDLPIVTLTDPATFECTTENDYNFVGTPAGGVFTTTAPAAALTQDGGAGTATLDVSEVSPGSYDVTYTYTDVNGCVNSETVSVEVCEFDLALIKTLNAASDDPIVPGSTVVFDIEVINQGTVTAYDVQVNDYFPSDLILDDSGWTVNAKGVELITPIASINPNGGSETVTIQFTVDSDFQGSTIINNAEIAFATRNDDSGINTVDSDSTPDNEDGTTVDSPDNDTAETDGGDDYDPEQITVEQMYDLAIDKNLLSAGPFMQGSLVTYEVIVTNEGTLDAANIEATDTPMTGLNYVSSNAGTIANVTETSDGVWLLSSLPKGASETIEVTYEVDNMFMGSTLRNDVQITADNGDDVDSDPDTDVTVDEDMDGEGDDDDEDEVTIAVGQRYDLAIDKNILTMGPYIQGQMVTYEIIVINQGSLDAANIEVVDLAEMGLIYVSSNASSIANVNEPTSGTWVVLDLDQNMTQSIEVTYQISPTFQGTSLRNDVQITVDDGDDEDSDPDTDVTVDEDGDMNGDDDDEAMAVLNVTQVYDLAIDKNLLSAGPFEQESFVTYEIIVTNEGSLDAANVEVTDTPQTGLNYVSSNAGTIANVTETSPGVWVIADLDQTLTETIEVTYQIDANFQGTSLDNDAQITADDGDDVDSDPTTGDDVDEDGDLNGDDDDEDEVTIPVDQVYDLAIDKNLLSAGPFEQESFVTYEIIVTNEGSLDAANVEVTDTPQTGLNYVSSNAGTIANVTEISAGVWVIADLDSNIN